MATGDYRPTGVAGARSSRCLYGARGERANRWLYDVPEFVEEERSLEHGTLDAKVSPIGEKLQRSRIKVLKENAELGLVRIGEGAKVVGQRQVIVELRPVPGTVNGFGQVLRIFRLYYAEPDHPEDSLLALHLASKGEGEAGKIEQNASIKIAEERVDGWCSE